MAKKKNRPTDTSFNFRCHREELELFRFAAEQEGFGGRIGTWLMFHARNLAKTHEAKFLRQKRRRLE